MDVNSINNGIDNLNLVPQQNLDRTNQSQASHEIVKDDGMPYKVYTPFSKKWINKIST